MKSPGKASGSPASAKVDIGDDQGGGTTSVAPVERDSTGRVVKGALNPGGMSKEQRLVREGMQQWLAGPEMQARFKEAYAKLLDEGNPVIVKDAAERYMGKVKDVVEHQGDAAPLRLTMLTREEVLAIAKGEVP